MGSVSGNTQGVSGRAGQPGGCCSQPQTPHSGSAEINSKGQLQRENEVTKYAAGRRVKGGGVVLAPLSTADAGTGAGDGVRRGRSLGLRQSSGGGAPKLGGQERGEQCRLRIET